MADILSDLSKAASGIVSTAQQDLTNFGHDAQAAVNKATQNTLHLAASGVNAGGQIFGPLADQFGHDPHAFMLNVVTKARRSARELCIRVAERTGRLHYVFDTPHGKRRVDAKPSASASANAVALTLALAAIDAPATLAEESGRAATGLPVKPRGLSGFTIFPVAVHPHGLMGGEANERGLIEGAPVPTPFDLLLAIAIPIIIGIAIKVLPGLIAGAGAAIQSVLNPGPTDAQKQAAAQQQQQDQQKSTMITVGVVAAVLVVTGLGIFLATRKRKAA